MIFKGSKQRLLGGDTAPQGKAADAMMIEVDFTAHQAMKPVSAHGKLLAEQIDVAGLTGAANEDDVPSQRRMRIKFEMLGHRLPRYMNCPTNADTWLSYER